MIKEQEASLHALHEIRDIMARSARFLSLSGWSGVWAGCVALAGSFIAQTWLRELPETYQSSGNVQTSISIDEYNATASQFVMLALAVFIVALIGGWYFTWRKTRQQGVSLWNNASKKMVAQIAIPMVAGGIFALNFLFDRQESYIAPTCLVFYGLALINGSKYTLSDIKYLGLCEVVLGCICLFVPGFGLAFWAIGFGGLHILYGIIMWNKYDKYTTKQDPAG
jgi:hypothetical protein